MKRIILLLITFSCLGWMKNSTNKRPIKANAKVIQTLKQQSQAHKLDTLTTEDRQHYLVKIDQQNITKPQSTSRDFKSNSLYATVLLEVTNTTSDTLKYITMSCAWSHVLKANNTQIHVMAIYCQSDHPIFEMILPYRTVTFTIPVNYKKATIPPGTPFKLGMFVYKFKNKHDLSLFRQVL